MREEEIKLKIALAGEGGLVEAENGERLAYSSDKDLQEALGLWIFSTMEENDMMDAEVEIRIRGRD